MGRGKDRDNTAEWSHLKASMPMLMSISLAGIPFIGGELTSITSCGREGKGQG